MVDSPLSGDIDAVAKLLPLTSRGNAEEARYAGGMRSRLVLLITLGALALAAAATAAAGSATGLHGSVSSSQPVCIEGRPCNMPVAGVVLLFRSDRRTIVSAMTRANGTYRLQLPRGRYSVFVEGRGPIARVTPSTVRVVAGRMRRIDFDLDRGLQKPLHGSDVLTDGGLSEP